MTTDRIKEFYIVTLLILLGALLLSSCAYTGKVYEKEGKQYGVIEGAFRQRWYNFYERGLSYIEGEYWEDAEADFREAILRRDEDRRRARTYGLHFIDYFPHRELAFALLKQNRSSEAAEEAQKSLSMVETSKAQYILDEARRLMLEKSGEDKDPPEITIHSPAAGEFVKGKRITVKGSVKDDGYVKEVFVNGRRAPIFVSEKEILFSVETECAEGKNSIIVSATDLVGKKSEATIEIIADNQGPVLAIDEITSLEKGGARINGYIRDDNGIAWLAIDGERVLSEIKEEREFSADIFPKSGSIARFTARDYAGNETNGEIDISKPPDPTPKSDAAPPILLLKDKERLKKVFTDSIYFEGVARDDVGIESLTIAGVEQSKRGKRHIFFNFFAALKEGLNEIEIKATDISGKTTTKTIEVERVAPKARNLENRLAVSILPFYKKGDNSLLSDAAYENLINSIVSQRRFKVIDNSATERIVAELKISGSNLVDDEKAVSAGKAQKADAVIVGTITETKNSIEIYARLVDVETAAILEEKDAYREDKNLEGAKLLMDGLATKLKMAFPVLEGIVKSIEGDIIEIAFIEDATYELKPAQELILFKEAEVVDEQTKEIIGVEAYPVGRAKGKADKRKNIAQLKESEAPITIDYKAITK